MNRRLAAAVVVAVSAVVLASVLATTASGGAPLRKATGTPVPIMVVAPVKVQVGQAFENIFQSARAYAAWLNDHGGINGKPVKVIYCDDRGDPNQAVTCARQAVSSKVAAVVGSYSTNQASIVSVLEAANIAYFGTCCAAFPQEFSSKASFPFGSQWAINIGLGAAAAKGCENIGVLSYDVPGFKEFLDGLYDGALKGYGKTVKARAYVRLTDVGDLSPQVAQVTSGTDCVVLGVTEAYVMQFLAAMKQAGAKQRLIGMQGNLDAKACANFKSLCQNAIVVGTYPDMSSPVWATYRSALATYKAKKGLDYNSLGGLGAWAGLVGFTKIAKTIKGPITGPSFLAAASETVRLKTDGLIPPINFKYEWGTPGFARMFNRTVTFSTYRNGAFSVLTPGFHDMTPGFFGRKAGY